MSQMLLFPDPRPLVDKLGLEFFRHLPECPGVYLMRDEAGTVLYVGKAKNLKRRLASYRVANPDRFRRRHLRLLRAVTRIELQECPDEQSALARESELLRSLKPRFNRAGTWPGPQRFLGWRISDQGLDLAVAEEVEEGWHSHGPRGANLISLRASLLRLLWCAIHPQQATPIALMPEGWFSGRHNSVATIPHLDASGAVFEEAVARLEELVTGNSGHFMTWINARTSRQSHPFELAVRAVDLETVTRFAQRERALNRFGASARD
jgi:predicted GIY-YIG superfamily endonuclease